MPNYYTYAFQCLLSFLCRVTHIVTQLCVHLASELVAVACLYLPPHSLYPNCLYSKLRSRSVYTTDPAHYTIN